MAQIQIKTSQQIVPMIYAYTTPEIARHNGWVKIGYTEQDVEKRLIQQTHTADVEYKFEWKGNAIFDDGSGERFRDTDFHNYLRKLNYENNRANEWFRIGVDESKAKFYDFRATRGILESLGELTPYTLRNEQNEAVSQTVEYYNNTPKGEFLWNAKPRFGKSLSAYDFVKRIGAQHVLIVTNRPSIANSWFSDYQEFLGQESGYLFVSSTDSLADKKGVLSRKDYVLANENEEGIEYKCIEFVSLQDLKGSLYFGGKYDKLKEVADTEWDVLIIDEAHEGVDTYKTDVAFDHINRKFTLHLSGTPFKALANDKFPENAIYNWTYADEQRAKRDYVPEDGENNPYATLPKLNMFTYQMSEIVRDELKQGIEINGETEEYAFDLNTFFETVNGRFKHDSSVDKFLDALTTQHKFPFSTDELRAEIKHSFWLLNRVDSAKALAKKLENHPVFGEYKIILAAGDGKLDDADETEKSFDKVKNAIKEYDKTITLSVGQLTTGVTIPEWTAVLMLSSMKSPALYMQAAFRAQNPCLFQNEGKYYRKENAYVFDFDPARTLIIFEEFANDLNSTTASGRGDAETRKENIRELLNFFPVIGEDENGEMIELDAEKVMSIPRKIKSQEVVRRGFMSDFLFQNISNVFRAPQEVLDILNQLTAVKESDANININNDTADELSLNEEGEVELSDEYIIGQANDVFGDLIYEQVYNTLADGLHLDTVPDEEGGYVKEVVLHSVDSMMEIAEEKYKEELRTRDKRQLKQRLKESAKTIVKKAYTNYAIEEKKLEKEKEEKLAEGTATEAEIQAEFEKKHEENSKKLKEDIIEQVSDFVIDSEQEITKTVEKSKKEEKKREVEDDVRDHLRGFARTIPSFLMAYGDESVTLENFDTIIPDEVFKEVTSITLTQFRFLRDGGHYINPETGEEQYYEGKLFDSVVFNDSVKEFISLREKLANYFAEESKEDIFDYIPPQKTNQIYTPKKVVKQMVDLLEQENPGCFDDPDKTFADLYMKSGLYITEIVKRLFRSPKMKELYPNETQRLQHIFDMQVYGLAPTEIIYRIAIRYILGFNDDNLITKHNFRQVDSLVYAKEGTLEEKLDEVYEVN